MAAKKNSAMQSFTTSKNMHPGSEDKIPTAFSSEPRKTYFLKCGLAG